MNVPNLYRKLKQILADSNIALINKGLNSVHTLYDIPNELATLSDINYLPYLLRKDIIEISEENLGRPSTIRGFILCDKLTNIIIPDSVTSIDRTAFQLCTNLTSITIPDSVTSIDNYAFYDCTGLINVTIGNSITDINIGAFDGCVSLTDIYLSPIIPPALGSISAIPTTTTIHVPVGSGEAYRTATNWSYHSDRIVEDIEI